MRSAAAAFCALALLVSSARGAEPARIGVAAPLSDTAAILGAQVHEGATAAAAGAPGSPQVEIADDGCSAAGGAAAARRFIAAGVRIAIGFLCTEAVEAAMPLLKEAGIPAITVGARADSLTDRREKTGWPLFRLAPRADAEASAVAAIVTNLWRSELFAIVDDGTIYGRELAESLRAAAEQAALKPVFVDTYRPQMDNQVGLIGRLRKAGATQVFVGGDRDDIAVMARDAAELGAGLTFAGGEMLRSAPGEVPLAAGTIMIALPEWADIAGPRTVERLRASGIEPEGYVLPAYAAVEIAAAAMDMAAQTRRPLRDVLADQEFRTALGPIRFNANGDLADNPYRAFRYDGARFTPFGTH